LDDVGLRRANRTELVMGRVGGGSQFG
jgi:hypothetical protein